MKTKNVILGIAALAFAMGSAFASMLVTPGEIHFKPVNKDWDCKPIAECNENSENLCKVRVQTISGVKLAQVYLRGSECTIPLFDPRPFVGTIVLPQDLGEVAIEDVE